MLFSAATVCPALPAGQRHTLKRRLWVKLGSLSPPVFLRHRGRYGDPIVRPLQPSSPFVASARRGSAGAGGSDSSANVATVSGCRCGGGGTASGGADDTLGGVCDYGWPARARRGGLGGRRNEWRRSRRSARASGVAVQPVPAWPRRKTKDALAILRAAFSSSISRSGEAARYRLTRNAMRPQHYYPPPDARV